MIYTQTQIEKSQWFLLLMCSRCWQLVKLSWHLGGAEEPRSLFTCNTDPKLPGLVEAEPP